MAEQAQLTGPDLAAGIEATTLTDGARILGHAEGEPVLVVRTGDDFFAIGASCTHYGGPLAEGLIDGETVRCPWHHACFSLRTGEALRAPALKPVARWVVEQRDGMIYVSSAKDVDELIAEKKTLVSKGTAPRSVVILGAGAAGNAAAEMLRREGYEGPVTMLGDEDSVPYDRPNLSKDYLAGNAPEEWIPLRSTDFYAQH